ncbi:MAG: uracil-DNA glycosylase family protein, partial [Dehalococcoidia bacterium]|nr:uracil-DNA glycosylase family protein [Dehalococcoidia bacterium]
MTYSPIEHGCLCDSCPLNGRAVVVPPEIRPGRPLCAGQEPGKNEERELKPFIGKSGKEFMEALRQAGLRREQVSVTNARLCRLPNYKAHVADDRKSLECCRPRLIDEMRAAPATLLMGAHAFMSAVGFEDVGEEGLQRSQGYPIEVDVTLPHDLAPKKVKAVAVVHPAAVLRKRRLTEDF